MALWQDERRRRRGLGFSGYGHRAAIDQARRLGLMGMNDSAAAPDGLTRGKKAGS